MDDETKIKELLKTPEMKGKTIVRSKHVDYRCWCDHGKMRVLGIIDTDKLPDCPDCKGTGNPEMVDDGWFVVDKCECCGHEERKPIII